MLPLFFLINAGIILTICQKEWGKRLNEDKIGRNFRYSKKISPYGGAHFMEPYEYVDVAQIRKLEDCKGIVVGQLTENGEECVDFNAKRINTHMYVTATSGSGKTYGFVKPYIFQSLKRRHSLIMTDPKGELYRDTAGFLMDNGYHVRRLDFKNLEISDGWDCMKLLRGKKMRTKVQIFSNAVISNISPNDNSIFAKGSDSLLQALILRVLLGHEFTEEKKNIKEVYKMLQNPAGYEFLDKMFDRNRLNEEEQLCLPPYLAYKQGSENLSANIATHLANGLQLFQDDLLCDVLSTDDIDLILPGKEPCAYYCVFPDDHDTYRFVISLFFTMFFIELVDFADDQPDLKLPISVDFLLDEFPSIGIIPDWAKKMSTVRSRGISCVMITQDFTQLKQNYKETWPTILNNCGALVTLGINEMETAEWVSKRIGEVSIEVESSSESEIAGQRRKSLITKQSVGVGKRSLFTPAEIFEIGKDNNLVVIAGRNPIYSKKTPYTIFKEAKYLREIQKNDILRINDKTGKSIFRACENEYVHQYWQTHDLQLAGNAEELSDALYTKASESPLTIILAVLKEDLIAMWKCAKKIMGQDCTQIQAHQRGGRVGQKDEPLKAYTIAEKGAFKAFYDAYRYTISRNRNAENGKYTFRLFELDEDSGEKKMDERLSHKEQGGNATISEDRNIEKTRGDNQKERHKKSELPENLHDSVGQTSPKAIFIPKTNTLQETVTINAEVSAEGEKIKSGYTTPPRKKGNISGKT